MRRVILTAIFLFEVVPCSGGTIYVDADAPGANNGTSWVDAYRFLQNALAAAVSGDTIQVAEGVYQPDASTANPDGTGDRTASFALKSGITIKGGYAGYGQGDPDARDIDEYETILSGDLNGDDGPNFTNNGENSYHVVTGSSTTLTAILEGFTIIAGNANGYFVDYQDVGGGLFAYNGTPKVIGCTFTGNRATSGGGGIYIYGYSIVPMFVDCRFVGNKGGSRGGAIYNTRSSPTIINCEFSGNNAGQGGAMFDYRNQSHPTLINCTLFGNTASTGGGIKTYDSASEVIKNSVLWGNSDNGGTDASAQIDTSSGGTPTVSYSCVQGGWTGTGNTGNDPMLVDADGPDDIAGTEDDNLRINSFSACIDAGDNTAVPMGTVTDIEGNARFTDDPDTNDTGNGTPPIVDMGAHEYTGPVVALGISPDGLDFRVLYGDNDVNSQFIYISNTGGGTLNWQISESCGWLETVPSAGTCTTEIDESEISVNSSGLETGVYECDLTVYDNNALNSPQTVQVVLHITEIAPSEYWRDYIEFPTDPFKSEEISENDPGWVKFTIILAPPYDPNTVYFQDSREYLFHYDFATEFLTPFIGMSRSGYNAISLYEQNQQAALGAVIMPANPGIEEYGIQLIRYDPYTKEEVADMFNAVKASIIAEPDVEAFYFPSYEQLAAAEANRTWLEGQGIPISSTARWAEGNACYSAGWALGTLKYFDGNQIASAYETGELLPEDILLTNGVPAEVPFVAGILTLTASTPSSHVAILAQTFGVPFGHLALAEDANLAQQLVGRLVLVCVGEQDGVGNIGIKDMTGLLTGGEKNEILALKIPEELEITATEPYGGYSANTDGLVPDDIRYFGGKAANFGMLRRSIPDNCPNAAALSFDVWNEFLDQGLTPQESTIIPARGYVLFWADNEESQGIRHAGFKLSEGGESIGLFDIDGSSLIDGLEFGEQTTDASFGRTPDGYDNWTFFYGTDITPNASNTGGSGNPASGLFINEFMADNDNIVADEYGEYEDWIELYNSGQTSVDLGGMYLSDDLDDPTNWMIPVGISGTTLREEIANRLGGYTYPVSNLAALSADLAAIRNIITNPAITTFNPQVSNAIIAMLQNPDYGFDPNKKIRFRSSTNVEDSNRFSGAGLYDSYSGCLADDLDGDESGPCLCDPNESNERGVFRAIRKVYASFYNENAFLERLRHRVDEDDVGMGILVHHSSPDQFELANGVATLEKWAGDPNRYIKLVTQKGAVSVANPEDGSIPEEVKVIYKSESEIEPTLVRSSNLVILGETVLDWPEDYNGFAQLLSEASEEFEAETGKTDYLLDFEYKKLLPGASLPEGGLAIKQIREIPKAEQGVSVTTPFLVNEPMQYVTFQGEGGDIFSNHLLKSRLVLGTKSMWLMPENLANSFYGNIYLEYVADGRIRTITGQLPLLPGHTHSFGSTTANDGWVMHHLANPRAYTLITDNIDVQIGPTESPIVTLSDLGWGLQTDIKGLRVRADYAQPPWAGQPTRYEIIICPELYNYLFQQRSFTQAGISIATSFYYAYWESMILTYPLSHFVETTITGLTTEPIVLHGYYSQTFNPNHHNFGEHFLFEPRLEPGISQNILSELEAQNIQLIYYLDDPYNPSISTLSYEDIPFLVSDIDNDGNVDFSDFARLGSKWLYIVCGECEGADLTGDGRVGIDDLLEFSQQWLEEL